MSNDPKDDQVAPEVLKPQTDDASSASDTSEADGAAKPAIAVPSKRQRRATYRPSHKATFIGLAVVVGILAANAAVIAFVIKGQGKADAGAGTAEVSISSAALDKLGVTRDPGGNLGAQLLVNPNAQFNGTLTVAKDANFAGQLKLNGKLSGADATFVKLQAGETAIEKLDVNGDATISTLNLRKDFSVVGLTRLQGPVTLAQLLTVNNSVNIAGNLAVGGTLSVRSFHASSLVSDTTLTIGGHVITGGSSPTISPTGNLGSNGTVSISGNDAAGTVAVNIGAGGGGGTLANITFHSKYSNTPHVVVTQVGPGGSGVYINRTSAGFSIGVNGTIGPGGYAFDFIVMQ